MPCNGQRQTMVPQVSSLLLPSLLPSSSYHTEMCGDNCMDTHDRYPATSCFEMFKLYCHNVIVTFQTNKRQTYANIHAHSHTCTQTLLSKANTCQLLVRSINLFLMFKKLLIVKWLYSRCRNITTNQCLREYTGNTHTTWSQHCPPGW